MRYAAVISYFGERYVGWQRQKNGLSVQEVLERALSKAFGAEISATASGRTDAGVHALAQVVHFDAETSIPVDKIPFAVNACLPSDISMLSCEIAPDNFNARYSAKRKTYCYKLYLSRQPRPMLEPTHERISQPLDIRAMRLAADEIEGEHDFKCFEAAGSVIKNTIRRVYEIKIDFKPLDSVKTVFQSNNCPKDLSGGNLSISDDKYVENLSGKTGGADCENRDCNSENAGAEIDLNGKSENAAICADGKFENDGAAEDFAGSVFDGTLEISVTGNGFLYNMVRIIAGTLVYCGLKKLTAADVKKAIESGDRTLAGKTLPAKGLHLVSVVY